MKHWPSPPPRTAPHIRRRVPMFHPVPVAPRKDGWTVQRQAWFIGMLAETRSVIEACRRIGMGRESAYRLRKRPGAAGFAAAWDAALGTPHEPVNLASAKSTGLDAGYRHRAGLIRTVMDRGRYAASVCKLDNNALLQFIAQLDRSAVEEDHGAGKPQPSSRRCV